MKIIPLKSIQKIMIDATQKLTTRLMGKQIERQTDKQKISKLLIRQLFKDFKQIFFKNILGNISLLSFYKHFNNQNYVHQLISYYILKTTSIIFVKITDYWLLVE